MGLSKSFLEGFSPEGLARQGGGALPKRTIMVHCHDREILKAQAQAVQVVATGVPDLGRAWRYAVELTQKQGGAAIAAPAGMRRGHRDLGPGRRGG